MATRHLVASVTDAQCHIGLWHHRQLQDALCVNLDLAGDAQLKAWLAPYRDIVLYILCDVLDEHYQLEHLPHVGSRARRQLLLRKCSHWPALVGTLSIHWLGQRRGARVEDRYLLAGIASESPFAAWVERMQLPQWRVRGVYLQALLLPGLLPPGQISTASHGLCLQLSSGRLRLSYLQQGLLCFSRQVLHSGLDNQAQWLAREVEQTRVYLQAQQWLTEAAPLVVYMLVAEAAEPQINVADADALAGETSIVTIVLPPFTPPAPHVAAIPAVVHASMQRLLDTCAQLPDVAAPAWTARDQQRRIRHMLGMAFLLLWLISGAWCWQGYQQYQQACRRVQQLHHQQEMLVAKLPAAPVNDAHDQQLQNVLSFAQSLSRAQRSPAQIWHILQAVIRPAMAWRVSSLQWTHEPTLATQQPLTEVARRREPSDRIAVFMTLQANAAIPAVQRHADWQALMAALRQQASIAHIQVLPAQPTAGPAPGAQALSATSRAVYTLKFDVRPDS